MPKLLRHDAAATTFHECVIVGEFNILYIIVIIIIIIIIIAVY